MRDFVKNYINLIFRLGLSAVIISTLLLFSNLTSEPFETPKFLVLLTFTGVILFLGTLKFTIANKIVLTRTPFDLPLILLLATAVISTFLSPNLYVSLLGSQFRVTTGLVAIIVLVLFYFILVNNFKTLKDIRFFIHTFLGAGAILSILTLLSFGGIKFLSSQWNQTLNFTPTGQSFSTTTVLAMMLPLLVWGIISNTNIIFKIINAVLLTIFGVTIALTGGLSSYIAATLGLAVLLAANIKKVKIQGFAKVLDSLFLAVPLVLITLSAVLSFIPPVGNAKNPFYTQRQNFPREIQLPFNTSWKIAVSTFRDKPIFGSGPSTFVFNFTQYKPVEFNQTQFWNLRFDAPFNEYLNVLSTLGGLGIIALMLLTALFVSEALKSLSRSDYLEASLAASGLVFFTALTLHSLNLVVWVFGLLILALYMGLKKLENPSQITIGGSVPSFLFMICLAAVLLSFFFTTQFVKAEYHHKKAITALSENKGFPGYQELVKAEALNTVNEVYRVQLAQTSFALANALASAKGPSESSPAGSLTEEDKKTLGQLLQQSITEGRVATAISPRSAANWEVLGSIYRQMTGVSQDALKYSLDAYGRAIQLDPLNPNLRLAVGGLYYQIKNYDLAIRFFDDASSLKPDHPNFLYNLALALREKGNFTEATKVAERILTLITDKNSEDYQKAAELLSDLNARVQSDIQPPAAQTNSALEQKNLPRVELPKTGNLSTPSALEK